MVDHQHIDAARPGVGDRTVADRAAVEGDQDGGAVVDQLVDGGDVGAVAFEDAVGDMDLRFDVEMPQVSSHQSAGTCSIDIIIAEERDVLLALDRGDQPVCRGVHRGQRRGVGHEVADGRHEVAFGVGGGDAAGGDDAAQDLAEIGLLGDGLRGPRPRWRRGDRPRTRPVTDCSTSRKIWRVSGICPRELGVSAAKLKRRLGFAA